MATKLRRLQITEVSLVDAGDNKGAEIVIAKRRADESEPGAPQEITKDKEPEMEFDINKLPEEFRKSVEEALKAKEAEGVAKGKAEATPAPEAPPAVPAPVEKAKFELPEAIQKQLDLQNEMIEKLNKQIEAGKEAETITKAKAAYPSLANVEEIGKGLYRLDKADAALAGEVRKALASAQAVAKMSDKITKQVGVSGEASEQSPEVQLDNIAKRIQKEEGVPFSKAYTLALERNQELYTAYSNANTRTVDGE